MKKRILLMLFAFSIIIVGVIYSQLSTGWKNSAQIVIGSVEEVGLEDAHMVAKARIDTGAGVASISAEIVEIRKATTPGKADRVVFRVPDSNNKAATMERDIVAWQNIKKKGAEGYTKRPVVRMDFCIGGKKIDARVNLSDRTDFIYPVLIGRNVLKTGDFMIDPSKKFLQEPDCP